MITRPRGQRCRAASGPFDVVLANLIASLLVRLADGLVEEVRPGGTLLASGIFDEPRGRGRRGVRGARPASSRERSAEGDWVALEVVRPAEPTRGRCATIAPEVPHRHDARSRPADRCPTCRSFPLILGTHITLAIALFLPSLLLPFTLRNRLVNQGYDAPQPGRFVRLAAVDPGARDDRHRGRARAHRARDGHRPRPADARAAVAARQPRDVRRSPRSSRSSSSGPTLRRLVRRDGIETDADRAAWRARARRQRYIAYAITTAVGLIAFMMSTKPVLW